MCLPPECLDCGVCCFSRLPAYVRVLGADHARLADQAGRLVWFEGNRAFMRMVEGHCAALAREVASGHLVCGEYLARPQVCRDLVRGSRACLAEIALKGERPALCPGR